MDDLTIDKNGRRSKRPVSYTRCTIPQRRDSVRALVAGEEAGAHEVTVETVEAKVKEVRRL